MCYEWIDEVITEGLFIVFIQLPFCYIVGTCHRNMHAVKEIRRKYFCDTTILDINGVDLLFPFLDQFPVQKNIHPQSIADLAAIEYCHHLDYLFSKEQKKEEYARIELILSESGIPLTFRKPWMYEMLLDKQYFYISHIPEIYIPLSLLKLPLKFTPQRHKRKQNTHYTL